MALRKEHGLFPREGKPASPLGSQRMALQHARRRALTAPRGQSRAAHCPALFHESLGKS